MFLLLRIRTNTITPSCPTTSSHATIFTADLSNDLRPQCQSFHRPYGAHLAICVVVAAVVTIAAALIVIPGLIIGASTGLKTAERLSAESDLRATLLQFLGGSAIALGVYYTARTVHVSREGQVTDRFTAAINQLGNDQLDVRVGGIFALERIARDSPTESGGTGGAADVYP